jgi:hypothetical protein
MNWDAIGAGGEILGAFAVVFSLAYLARQIRHSTLATHAASRDAMAKSTIDILMGIAADPVMVSLLRRGQLDPESLDDDEVLRFDLMIYSIFESWEATFAQWHRGTLSDEDWEKWEMVISQYVAQPGTQAFWGRSERQFSKAFREYIDSREPGDAYTWGEL